MNKALRRGFATISLAVFLVGCAEREPEIPAGAGGASGSGTSVEDIGFGEALAQIRGHHLVSLELLEAGDTEGAEVHAGHPVHEILDSVSSELAEHDPESGTRLEDALNAGLDAVTSGASEEDVEAAYVEAASATEEALDAVVGDEAAEPSYQGSVIAQLLATAAHEYEEAVAAEEGTEASVELLAEYQDGYAFVQEARNLYDAVAEDVESASAEEAEEIEEAFADLESALPAPEPPSELADALDVEAAAELIGHELEETVDAEPVTESDPAEVVEKINELLTEIEETYADGDADAAAELSAEAYLENYEVIEAEVIELAPEVNDELEPLLGADLRAEIQAGAPQEDIESMIDRARTLLEEALAAIEEEE